MAKGGVNLFMDIPDEAITKVYDLAIALLDYVQLNDVFYRNINDPDLHKVVKKASNKASAALDEYKKIPDALRKQLSADDPSERESLAPELDVPIEVFSGHYASQNSITSVRQCKILSTAIHNIKAVMRERKLNQRIGMRR